MARRPETTSYAGRVITNIRWGVRYGVIFAAFYCATALAIFAVEGSGTFSRYGITLGRALASYVLGRRAWRRNVRLAETANKVLDWISVRWHLCRVPSGTHSSPCHGRGGPEGARVRSWRVFARLGYSVWPQYASNFQ